MVAVDDQASREAILGQLVPDIVGVAANRAVSAVAEMRAERSASIDGGADLGRVGGGVTEGDDDASGDCAADELGRAGIFRRKRYDPNLASGGGLKLLELVPIGRAAMLGRVSAAWTIDVRDVGAFQVDAGDCVRDVRKAAAGVGDRGQAVREGREAGSGHRGAILRDTERALGGGDLGDFFARQFERAEFLPAVAVGLDVEEAGGEPGRLFVAGRLIGQFDARRRCGRRRFGSRLRAAFDSGGR